MYSDYKERTSQSVYILSDRTSRPRGASYMKRLSRLSSCWLFIKQEDNFRYNLALYAPADVTWTGTAVCTRSSVGASRSSIFLSGEKYGASNIKHAIATNKARLTVSHVVHQQEVSLRVIRWLIATLATLAYLSRTVCLTDIHQLSLLCWWFLLGLQKNKIICHIVFARDAFWLLLEFA